MARVTSIRKRRGLAAVEAAILLPILILLLFGIIEYSWMYWKAQQIANASREGARVGARLSAQNSDVDAAIAVVMNGAGMGGSGYVVTKSPGTISLPPMTPGQQLTITVTVNYQNGIWLTHFPLLPVPISLSRKTTLAKEGPL